MFGQVPCSKLFDFSASWLSSYDVKAKKWAAHELVCTRYITPGSVETSFSEANNEEKVAIHFPNIGLSIPTIINAKDFI